jgi:hypothetical protein
LVARRWSAYKNDVRTAPIFTSIDFQHDHGPFAPEGAAHLKVAGMMGTQAFCKGSQAKRPVGEQSVAGAHPTAEQKNSPP